MDALPTIGSIMLPGHVIPLANLIALHAPVILDIAALDVALEAVGTHRQQELLPVFGNVVEVVGAEGRSRREIGCLLRIVLAEPKNSPFILIEGRTAGRVSSSSMILELFSASNSVWSRLPDR